ncbi:MAG: response regulator transcription factor [Nitrospira sp.]|nr:response regulator transcription factor [Nitrospira sp.]TKB89170.1 MAG: response regulator transcription factor [Nitrospira sp.]
MSTHILVVEDDERISSFIRRGLEAEGYLVDVVQDGREGVEKGMTPYDLILLDLLLPDQSGHEVCQTLRREQVQTPILILTAKDALEDKLSGFDHGADDYLTKPFAFEELLARIKALLRRRPSYNEDVVPLLQVADLMLDQSSREVRKGDTTLSLTRKEFDLLAFLMANPNKALSRTSILEHVWGYHYDTLTNTVDVYIGYLRKKIDAGSTIKLIQTVRDFGYKISDHQPS